jgi:hypothetical protein
MPPVHLPRHLREQLDGQSTGIVCSWADWLEYSEAILAVQPIERVKLLDRPEIDLGDTRRQARRAIARQYDNRFVFELPDKEEAGVPELAMSTEKWIVLCAVLAVAAFFAGVLYGEAQSRPMVEVSLDRALEYERAYESMDRREAEWRAARERGAEPNLPPKHVPAGGMVIRE